MASFSINSLVFVNLWHIHNIFRAASGLEADLRKILQLYPVTAWFIHVHTLCLQTWDHFHLWPEVTRGHLVHLPSHTHTPPCIQPPAIVHCTDHKLYSVECCNNFAFYTRGCIFACFCTLVGRMCPEFCFVSINLFLRNYWPWILEPQMDSFNKYPVRMQPLCIMWLLGCKCFLLMQRFP